MTVKKTARTGGFAALVSRHKLINTNQLLDITNIKPLNIHTYNIVVGFNEKDQLQLLTKEDPEDEKKLIKEYNELKTSKCENISIDDIANCVNIEHYPNCSNTLIFYITKNAIREALVLKFENEQDFKRIYFTYKYFKMRNRLAKNTNTNSYNTDSLFTKKKTFNVNRKSADDYSLIEKGRQDYDLLHTIDNDGLTHISVQQKNLNLRFDQPMSLIGIRNDTNDVAEIDSIIYTDIDIPTKPDRKRMFQKKTKAPQPPALKDNQKVLKGEFVRVNVDRSPDIIPKENKPNKIPDILMFRDVKPKRNSPPGNLWTASNKAAGYESDREEWKTSRSQFSTTAFDSLARPTKMAMALTLRKPQRLDPVPQYYRMSSEPKPKLSPTPVQFRPNNFMQRPRLPRPTPEIKRNLLSTDHRKFTSLQNLEIPKKLSEPKKPLEPKKNNYSNISHRITGLTNKLRDLGSPSNTLGRFKAQSQGDVANLKPVLKTNCQDGAKRSVVRTCSSEPPKKVTFSAFATVQVV